MEPQGMATALDALLDRSDDAVIVAVTTRQDPVIRIVRANPAMCALTGYTDDDLHGESPGVLVGPETDLEALRRMQDSLRRDGTSTEELSLQSSNGTHIRVLATYHLLPDQDGVEWYLATFHDRSDEAAAAAALWRSEEWAQAMLSSVSDIILVTDPDTTIRWVTPSVQHRLGLDPQALIGTACWDLLHPDDAVAAARDWEHAVSGTSSVRPSTLRVRHADGSLRTMSCTATDLTHHPAIGGLVISANDITEQARALELVTEQTELLESMARGAPLEVTLQQLALMLERRLPGTFAALAVSEDARRVRIRAAPSLAREIVNRLDEIDLETTPLGTALTEAGNAWLSWDLTVTSPLSNDPMRIDYGIDHAHAAQILAPGTGERLGSIALFATSRPVLDPETAELLDWARNLAALAIERHRFESALEHRSLYDELTGLPNRALLMRRMQESTRRAARLGYGMAVLFLDIDRFRVINDSLGHEAGDRLLSLVSDRLIPQLRPGDTMGRLGGDKFLVVCNRITSESDALEAAGRLLDGLEDPFELEEAQGSMVLTASVGIVLNSEHRLDPEALVRNAEVAMYRAKDQGRNQFVVFTEHVDLRTVEKLSLEQSLRIAVEGGELALHVQPVVHMSDRRVHHVEALVRWHRPGHGLILPGAFIPLAEESGLIVPLGKWVLTEACRTAAAWADTVDGRQVDIAVNLSARQLNAPGLLGVVEKVLDAAGLAPQRLCLEVTESALVHDLAGAKRTLLDLKALGVRLAIDDFGTGYATLDYIRHFSMADELKIDRAFIDGVERESSHEAAIVSAAVAIAHSLGALSVAEGVESEIQMEVLADLGVDLAQGFVIDRPFPIDELSERLNLMGTPATHS